MRTNVKLLLAFFTVYFTLLTGEIPEMVMKWDGLLCLKDCIPLLENELRKIPNLASFSVNARAGTAIMQWKPEYPFSYEPFNLTTRTVGIRIADFRVKVIGYIVHREDNFFLVSRGDQTTFLLLGPIRAVPARYIIDQNIASHSLPVEMRKRFLEASYHKELIEIEGPLFQPLRYWLALVVEQLHVPKAAKLKSTTQEIEKYKLP